MTIRFAIFLYGVGSLYIFGFAYGMGRAIRPRPNFIAPCHGIMNLKTLCRNYENFRLLMHILSVVLYFRTELGNHALCISDIDMLPICELLKFLYKNDPPQKILQSLTELTEYTDSVEINSVDPMLVGNGPFK